MDASSRRALHPLGRRTLSVLALIGVAFSSACDASTASRHRSATSSPPPPTAASSSGAPGSSHPTDASQLLDDSRGALFVNSSGFHVSGTLSSVLVTIDLTFGPHGVASGTVTKAGGGALTVRQVADGTRYARANRAWLSDGQGRDLSALADRWVVVPSKTAPPDHFELTELADRGFLYDAAASRNLNGTIVGPRVVDGIRAYVVVEFSDTYAFAASGPPRPIAFSSDHGRQKLRFDHYDAPLRVAAPPRGDVVPIPSR